MRKALTKVIPLLVLVCSSMALAAWQFGFCDWSLTMDPEGPAVRPIGAWGFLLSALICLLAKRALEMKTRSGFFVTLLTMWLFFIVAVTTIDVLSGGALGVHSLMVSEKEGLRSEGYPAVASLIALFLMGCQGLAVTFNTNNYPRRSRVIGTALLVLGALAVLGHALHNKTMMLDFPGDTPGMSLPSALMTLLLGVQVTMQANCHSSHHCEEKKAPAPA